MAYKRITSMDIWEIIRRRHGGQSISHIARALGYDRKTVRNYLAMAERQGLDFSQPLPPKDALAKQLSLVKIRHRKISKSEQLLGPFLEEIKTLVTDRSHPLKPKIAFEVICQRHELHGKISYSSFKRWMRQQAISPSQKKSTCRIEVEAGQEVQIDYAKMGLLFDPLTGKRRTVYAFIATLSHSRYKFVQFVFKQDQQSFTASHIAMFDFFAGVPVRILIDNLKSGVIKPDLYDPRLNRTYAEMAEHYRCFIDPCRVRRPQDKGKVERDVQTVRQQFRKLLALYPTLELPQANELIEKWSREEYGQREHGTTHLKPYLVFINKEQPALKPLPSEPFQIARWKQVTVHPDHYIQLGKKAYSVPHAFVGKKLWARATDKIVQIYDDHRLIKQHLITPYYRHTDWNDFPPNMQAALDDGMPRHLQSRAQRIGPLFAKLIRSVLQPHAFRNMRRAQGLLALTEKTTPALVEKAAAYAMEHQLNVTPRLFKKLMRILQENPETEPPALSEQSQGFVRQMTYFQHKP